MTVRAGYCTECGLDVWLREDGGCISGHESFRILDDWEVPLPTELDKFNWGAFFFPILWPLSKGPIAWAGILFALSSVLLLLGPLYFVADFLLRVWYGRNANLLLWNKAAWLVDPAALRRSQTTWGITGVLILLSGIALLISYAAGMVDL